MRHEAPPSSDVKPSLSPVLSEMTGPLPGSETPAMFTQESVLMPTALWNVSPPSVLRKMPPSLAIHAVPATWRYWPSTKAAAKSGDRKMPWRSKCTC